MAVFALAMKRGVSIALAAIAFALCSPYASGQETPGKWNAPNDPRIIQGADNPNQNRWNALSPWGRTERIAPPDAQHKDPFRIFDDVYYVGFQTVSAYLVVTSDGLVLIDTGYAETADWLVDNIIRSGFDPADIRYVFVTHAHRDHVGGAARIQRLSNARVGLSLLDWEFLEMQQAGSPPAQELRRDLVLDDGAQITLGNSSFRFYVTPGHTPGATTIEFMVRDGTRRYRAVSPGGLGLHYSPEWGPVYRDSMQRLRDLGPWDVMLSNHPFAMPKDLADVESALASHRNGDSHPAVPGREAIDHFLSEVIRIVDLKLEAEPPTPQPLRPPRGP